MSEQTKRTELLDKISALLAKTTSNGCTEAEAIAAAELAGKLMTKYGLKLAELEAVRAPATVCEADGVAIGLKRCHEVVHILNAIARYTNTRSWYNQRGIIHVDKNRRRAHKHDGVIGVFFGLEADVQVAIYLTNILRVAMDSEWNKYWASSDKSSPARTARADFMHGMCDRLSSRLAALKKAQETSQNANDCRAIVLAKERIVTEAYEATGIKIRTVSTRERWMSGSTYDAGHAAGGRVAINSGELPRTVKPRE